MEQLPPSKLTTDELGQRYQTVLQDEMGLITNTDNDHDIFFKYPDLGTLFLAFDAEKDPEYFMLVFPNFANTTDLNLDREGMLKAVNAVNSRNKAVKLTVRPDTIASTCDVVATIECFLAARDEAPSEQLLRATIRRNLSALRGGVRSLIDEAQKLTPPPAPEAPPVAVQIR